MEVGGAGRLKGVACLKGVAVVRPYPGSLECQDGTSETDQEYGRAGGRVRVTGSIWQTVGSK